MSDVSDLGASTDPTGMIGSTFAGRYCLQTLVAAGASTLIYEATDETNGRLVTLKVVRPSVGVVADFRERFGVTMEQVAALAHPHIAAIYDWGEAEWVGEMTAFVVIEHLAGGSLRDLFDRGRRLSPSQALLVGLEACKALDHAHRRGLLHTELTPSKMVFGEDRRLRVVDFGFAQLLGEAAWAEPATVPTHVARYSSPEQALSMEVTDRTDVYALALVLVEAVAGEVPFASDSTVSTLSARVGRLMPVSADLGPLAAVIERAGRPEADERASAAELGQMLMAAASKLPRPEPLPLLSSSLFDVPPDQLRSPDDPTGGVMRPGEPAPSSTTPPSASPTTQVDAEPLLVVPLDADVPAPPAPDEAPEAAAEDGRSSVDDSAGDRAPTDADDSAGPTTAAAMAGGLGVAAAAPSTDLDSADEGTEAAAGASAAGGEPAAEDDRDAPGPAGVAGVAGVAAAAGVAGAAAARTASESDRPAGVDDLDAALVEAGIDPATIASDGAGEPTGSSSPIGVAPAAGAASAEPTPDDAPAGLAPPLAPPPAASGAAVSSPPPDAPASSAAEPTESDVSTGAAAATAATTSGLEGLVGLDAAAESIDEIDDVDLAADGGPPTEGGRRRFPWRLVIPVLIIGSLAGLGYLAWTLFVTPSYEVPDVTGTPAVEALDEVDDFGWELAVERVRDDDERREGYVIRTVPEAGEEVAEGEPFLLVISDGPLFRELPELDGRSSAEAQTELARLELEVEVIEAYDEVVVVGDVISWTVPSDPSLVAGAQVLPGLEVLVTSSLGPEPRIVPDVVGGGLDGALGAITELRLVPVQDADQFSDEVPAGEVISQSPAPGTEVPRDSEVRFVMSKGPDVVELPDVSELSFDDAVQALADAGLVGVLSFGSTDGEFVSANVDGEVVQPGLVLRRGTQIDLVYL